MKEPAREPPTGPPCMVEGDEVRTRRDLEVRYRETFGTDLFRPRDEFDVDPRTVRGRALAMIDEVERVHAEVMAAIAAMPWYRRWPSRVAIAAILLWARVTAWWKT